MTFNEGKEKAHIKINQMITQIKTDQRISGISRQARKKEITERKNKEGSKEE